MYKNTDGLIEYRICPNTAFVTGLIHGITAFRFTWHLLYSAPVLDDLAVVIEAKDINCNVLLISRPDLVSVKNHEIAFRNRAQELNLLVLIFSSHLLEVFNKTLLAVVHQRIMLYIAGPNVSINHLDRSAQLCSAVKLNGVSLTGFQIVFHLCVYCESPDYTASR